MIADHIHDALSQVRLMQEIILTRRSFRGYNGKARMVGAVAVLCGAFIMSREWFPATDEAHLAGWLVVLGTALVLNYGALFVWFFFNKEVRKNAAMLVPAVDALPSLLMGAIFTAVFVQKGQYVLLPGMWMAMFGLAHVAYRQSLPMTNYGVGAYYVIFGVICLFWPTMQFTDPWPMGVCYFIGEMAGGCILYKNNCSNEERKE